MSKCVLFIHGLGSNNDVWKDLKKYIDDEKGYKKNKRYNNIEFKYYTYDTNIFDRPFTFAKKILINVAAFFDNDKESLLGCINSLSEGLRTYIDDDLKDFNEIEIIAHSMGGLIATRYVLDEIMNNYPLKVKKMLFICTPYIGSYFANILKTLGIASQETSEMTTKSEFLKTLKNDMKQHNFENKINHKFIFGSRDDIIKEYRNKLGNKHTEMTLEGNHNTILKNNQNFKYIEEFFLERNYDNFIDKLYSKAILNDNLRYSEKYIRKIEQTGIRTQFTTKLINQLLENDEKPLYTYMFELIKNHSYSPHKKFEGENYFIEDNINKITLETYWEEIINNENAKPFLYIGNRGSGKTITQNMWIHKNFEEMEKLNIFHVRCDVHKIFKMLHESILKLDYNNVPIESYLDMQFLYIFLKYRDGKYNAKKATSKLMKKIHDLLLEKKYLENTEVVAGNEKFSNLNDFLDKKSNDIFHSEVKTRNNNDKSYSYALELMKNITDDINTKPPYEYNEHRINSYSKLIERIFIQPDNFEQDTDISNLIEFLSIDEKDELILRINSILKDNSYHSEHTKKQKMKLLFSEFFDIEYENKKTTTQLWIKVSKFIQQVILSENYKIIKLIDGIDNIIIHETEKDKRFFDIKLNEICTILNRGNTPNIYYLITLRDDTFAVLESKIAKLIAGYDVNQQNIFNLEYHNYSTFAHRFQ